MGKERRRRSQRALQTIVLSWASILGCMRSHVWGSGKTGLSKRVTWCDLRWNRVSLEVAENRLWRGRAGTEMSGKGLCRAQEREDGGLDWGGSGAERTLGHLSNTHRMPGL